MNFLQFVFEFAVIIICSIGLIQHLKTKNIHSNFCYYTFLSNFAVFLFYTYNLAGQIFIYRGKVPYEDVIRGGITPAIFITFLIFHFILYPEKKKKFNHNVMNLIDIPAHYAVPILTFFDYLFFAQKGTLKYSYIKIYLTIVVVYIFYVYAHALLGLMIDCYPTKKRFPYFFLDYQTLGPIKAVIWFVGLFTFMTIFFAMFIFLDNNIF